MEDKLSNKEEIHFMGSGWAFPVSFSSENRTLRTSRYVENIKSSIDIILMTEKGTRITDPKFGSGLHKFFFRPMDKSLKEEIREEVITSLLDNEPRIEVKNVTVEYTDILNGIAEITIDYIYNQTNTRHNYVFPFHLKEGTNL